MAAFVGTYDTTFYHHGTGCGCPGCCGYATSTASNTIHYNDPSWQTYTPPATSDDIAAKKEEQEPRELPSWEPLPRIGEPRPGEMMPRRVMGARAPPA